MGVQASTHPSSFAIGAIHLAATASNFNNVKCLFKTFKFLKILILKNFGSYFASLWNLIRGLSQITFAFFGIFWPRTSLVCTFYVANYTFFWPPTHPSANVICERPLSTTVNLVALKIITFYPEVVAQIWLDPLWGFWGCWATFTVFVL